MCSLLKKEWKCITVRHPYSEMRHTCYIFILLAPTQTDRMNPVCSVNSRHRFLTFLESLEGGKISSGTQYLKDESFTRADPISLWPLPASSHVEIEL